MSGRWGRALRKRCDRRGSEERGKDYPSCGGDPASAWYGQYVLLDVTDVTAVKQDPNLVYIYNDPQYGLTFQWWTDADGGRAVYGNNVTYNNNVLQCADEDDDTTQYAMQFVPTQAGAAEINLAAIANGGVRSYKGYWVDRYQPPSPAPRLASQARLAKRPMTAAYSTGAAGASGGGYGQTIDIGSLTPDPKPNKILLPYGAVGNTYALSLNLAGAAFSDKFSWTLKAGTGKNDATNLAVITPSGATTAQFTLANLNDSDAGQQLPVTVQLTNNTAAPPVTYTLLFDIVVMQCDAISLAPTALMPVVVGAAYTQNLVAHGARDNFTWSVDASSVPPGLTWDDSSHQLSGTVTDAAQVGKAFSLVVGLAASDVIVDPLTVSLGITVQSAPVVASDMPPWEKIFIYAMAASGAAILALGAFALNRYKAAKENATESAHAEAGQGQVRARRRRSHLPDQQQRRPGRHPEQPGRPGAKATGRAGARSQAAKMTDPAALASSSTAPPASGSTTCRSRPVTVLSAQPARINSRRPALACVAAWVVEAAITPARAPYGRLPARLNLPAREIPCT
jgi:hypothetical protein